MPARKTVVAPLTPAVAVAVVQKTRGSAVRTLAPAIPLAVALIGGALTTSNSTGTTGGSRTPPRSPVSSGTVSVLRCGSTGSAACTAPYPMVEAGHPVDWWFVFKLNAAKFPMCGDPKGDGTDTRACPFGGDVQTSYRAFGQRFAFASSEAPALQDGGSTCLGDTVHDPVGATFDTVYHGGFHYVVWNDQFYDSPTIAGCTKECGSPWGHSKGVIAWNDDGVGMVMQGSTPSFPASGSSGHPRVNDGNTLGCVKDNDVQVSQHFFALRLDKDDLLEVLKGLSNASVVTDPKNPEIVSNGGPADVQEVVQTLGTKSQSTTLETGTLSTGIQMIAKPSNMHVPPWQMVSSVLGGASLRAATWWASPMIPTTTADTAIPCWDQTLSKPGPVEIATSGTWDGKVIGLKGGLGTDFNHAKVGVSTGGETHYAIFGDMNQQGALQGTCASSQNGRGGLFFVVDNATLNTSIAALIAGESAPVATVAK